MNTFWMVLGYVLMGLLGPLVRLLDAAGWESWYAVLARALFACAVIGLLALAFKQDAKIHNPEVWLLRGITGALAQLFFFIAIQLTGAGVGTLLNYTHFFWANLYLVLVLKRPAFKGFWPLMLSAALGVLLVIDPVFKGFGLGEGLGVLSGMLGGVAVLSIKELRKTDSALSVFLSLSVTGSVLALLMLLLGAGGAFPQRPPPLHDGRAWLFMLAIVVVAFGGQFFFTFGYKHVSVRLGSMLALLTPVIASLGGWLILDEALTSTFVLGAALILLSCVLVSRKERQLPGEPQE